jgi:uncharacterized membrane protein
MEAILGLVVLVVIGIPLVPFIMSLRMYSRLARQDREIEMLGDRVRRLEAQLRDARGARAPRVEPAQPVSPRAAAEPPPEEHPPVVLAPIVLPPETELPSEGGSHGDLPPRGGSHTHAADEAQPETRGFRLQAEGSEAQPESESLETRIGSRWLLYVGVAAIVIGAAYFEKLAIENGWIGETARVVQGAIVGLALVFAGTRFVRAGYALYGQMVSGGGAAVLYVTTFAAFVLYHLIDRPVAFALMAAITVMVAVLADRQRSQGLAVMAVGGGFATPFLLHGGSDMQVALFTYDAILVAGTVYLAGRRDWPLLHIVSYLFTLLTIAAWADRYYTPSKYLTTEVFMTVFCGMFVYVLRECRRSGSGASQLAALVLWTAPVAYYLGSLVVLARHEAALLIWLVAVALAGGIASAAVGALAGLLTWAAATLPLLLWSVQQTGSQWLASGLAATAGIYVIALAAQLRGMIDSDEDNPVYVIWLHLDGLLMFAAAYFLFEPVRVAWTGPLAAAFALWNGVVAGAIASRRRDYARHFGALAFTLLAIALALHYDGPAVTVGWAAEGAVIVALGLHERRAWLRVGGIALFTIAVVRTIGLLTEPAPVGQAVLFNARALSSIFVVALAYAIAWLHHRDPGAPDRAPGIAAPLIVAQIVTLVLLTSEITTYWGRYEGNLARQLMISVTWGAYSTALIVVGLWQRYAPIRYFAIVVLFVTIAKVFFLDLAELERIYRVLSVIVLGVLLLLTSYLYQRTREPRTANREP